MTGSYAFVVMHKSHPGELYAIRKKSPLIAAETKDGLVFASDVTAVMSECDEFYRIPEDTLAVAGEGGLKFFDESGEEVLLKPEKILWSRDAAEKNGFPHYMLKEINEEPEVIEKTAARFIKDGIPDFSEAGPEIAVATTKAYMTQCEVLYLAAVYLAYRGGRISRDECERLTSVMREQVPKTELLSSRL